MRDGLLFCTAKDTAGGCGTAEFSVWAGASRGAGFLPRRPHAPEALAQQTAYMLSSRWTFLHLPRR